MRVLVVDDRQAIHDDFRAILTPPRASGRLDAIERELFGRPQHDVTPPVDFDIDSAHQGQQALELVQRARAHDRPYALAFVDMRMPPGWDGAETVERLWQVDPDLEVVICTAYSDHDWDTISRLGQSSDQLLILKKPFDGIEVSQLARTLTRKWLLRRHAARTVSELESRVADYTAELAAAHAELTRRAAEREQVLRGLQTLMCPGPEPVRIGGCALAGYSEPADACGGEFWTCRALGAERVLLLAGDVLGAGVTSAVVAAGARGVVEGLTHDCPGLDPSQVLEAIHHALLDVAHGGWRMTCCVALFDRPAATLQLASAGHPAPYLLAGSSDEPRQLHRLLAGSTPLGQGTCRIESETRSLAGGEMLLFLGQGVTGRRGPDGERFGSGRLEALLTSPVWPRQAGAGRDALCEALDRFAAGTPLHDDLTLVVCQLEE